jgi:DNA mismatch repair protein MutS
LDEFLLQYQPEEVLFCGSLSDDNLKSTLQDATHVVFDNEPWVFQPILFHDSFQISRDEDVIVHLSLDRHPHLLECLGRLLRFIRQHDASHVCALQKPQFIAPEEHMRWNHDAVRELNVFSICEKRRSVVDKNKQKSIYDILSESMNSMGRRMLEKMLKHPLHNEKELHQRYARIESVSSERDFSFPVLIDIEWYMLRWSKGKLSKRLLGILFENYRIILETFVPTWSDFFSDTVTTQLRKFVNDIENTIDVEKMIGQESRFFKDTRDDLHADYTELESLEEQFKSFEQETGGKISSENENHVIVMTPRAWKQQMKNSKWIVMSETKSSVRVTSHDLVTLSTSIRALEKKIHTHLQERFDEFSTSLLERYGTFLCQLNKEIAEFSCVFPLARFFRDHHYVRPHCVSSLSHGYVKIKQMRHAIMEYIHPDSLFVPLDVELGGPESPLGYLMYGMNSSGKSTMLKSLGLCTWLAQCGLYVPAQSMEFSPFDALYTKIGIQDNLFLGHSTFVAEMNELLYMMKRSTSKTLIMCDELTSGTEAKSATGIVVASLMSFLEKKTCFLFTTHLHTVAQLPEISSHPQIYICHFKILRDKTPSLLIEDIRLRYDRQLYKGAGEEEYGIEIATAVGLPKAFIDKAKTIRRQIDIQVNAKSKPKTSRYNRRFLLTECVVCSSTSRLHTHHITPQKEFKTMTHHHQKDGLYNLVALCESCHESLHHTHAPIEARTQKIVV